MKDPIIITGAPRAGKTMIAGILNICGVFTGVVDKKFENIPLEKGVIHPYLKNQNMDIEGQHGNADTSNLMIPNNWSTNIQHIMKQQGLCDEKWMLKSSSASLIWPVWKHAFPRAKYIIVRRRTGDIVSSCMKTSYMKKYDNEEGWIEMCREYDKCYVEMIEAGLDCKVIWPHRMAYGDYEQIYELLEWLGLSWKSEILPWIDPKFWKLRKKKNV